MVIHGNHAIHAAVTAMQDVFARIRRDGGISAIDKDIVSVEEIFRLRGMDRMGIHAFVFLPSVAAR